MALQLAMYYVSSHASARYFLIRHGDVIKPTLTGPQKYWFPRLTTGRYRITSTVIYYLVRTFVYLAYNSSINSSYISHVARHEKCKNLWITFICKISIAKILIPWNLLHYSMFMLRMLSLNNLGCVHHVITNYTSTWNPSNATGIRTKNGSIICP